MITIWKKTRFWLPLTCHDKGLLGCRAGTIEGRGRAGAKAVIG